MVKRGTTTAGAHGRPAVSSQRGLRRLRGVGERNVVGDADVDLLVRFCAVELAPAGYALELACGGGARWARVAAARSRSGGIPARGRHAPAAMYVAMRAMRTPYTLSKYSRISALVHFGSVRSM